MSNKTVRAIRDGEFVETQPSEVDLVLEHPSSLLGNNINLVPLANAVSSQRLFYSNRFFSQADPLVDPDEPLVQNAHPDGRSFDEVLGERAGAARARRAGEVTSVGDDHVAVRYEDGEEHRVPLYQNLSLNRKNRFHQRPLVKQGDRIEPNQVLAGSNFTNARGTLALGRNAHVGVVPYLGYSMDDATVISESFAKRLRSEHLLDFETAVDPDIRRSKNHFLASMPRAFTTKQLDKLDTEGVVRPGQILEADDPIVLGTRPVRVQDADRLRGTFGRYMRNRRRDISQLWEHDEPGLVQDVVRRKDGSVHVTVGVEKPAKEADKIVSRSGAKFTISRIIPDEEMPRDKSGRVFDLLANPLGIPSRQNNSFIYELLMGKVAEKQGRPIVTNSFNAEDENWHDTVKRLLEENGLQDAEEVYDPIAARYLDNPITTGNMHVLKLQHQGAGKLSARGQGGYTQWEQPRKGGDEGGLSKRQSGLETIGLMSAGAYDYLRDGATVRGQRNDEYWRALRSGETPPTPGRPFAWDRMRAMLSGAGYTTTDLADGRLRMGPATDRDLERWRPEELENADLIDMKKGRGIKGGLFDESRAFTNKWSKISLDYPLPNPAFEGPILKLLGLRARDLDEVLSGEQELGEHGTGPAALYRALRSIDPAAERERQLDLVRGGVKTKRARAINVLNTLEGLERNKLHPRDLMISQVPVIPSRFRPFAMQGDSFIPGDVNELYQDVFRLRDQGRELRDAFGEDGAAEHPAAMYAGLQALYGHGTTANRKLAQKGVNGFLKQLLGTSPKYSVFQRNLFSKTVDSSGRGVAGLDPTLGIDEVGIPEKMAWKLYAPYIQRRLVREGSSPADAIRAVADETPKARATMLREIAERPGVVNRAPSWHKYNSTGAFFKVHDGNNIRVNPLLTTGHNLDFDGDQQIGYVVLSAPREVFESIDKDGHNSDSTKACGLFNIQRMFKDIEIPALKDGHEAFVVNLADCPRGELLRHKPDGKNGPIDFYEVPAGLQVIAFDEKTWSPIWADVSFFSVHPNREVEIVNLTRGLQILTDDDPRAVLGIDPSTPGFHVERFTPTEAKRRGVLVARFHTRHEVYPDEGYRQTTQFAGSERPLDASLGYFLGAMAGDGWTDCNKDSNAWYLADLKGHNADHVRRWLEGWVTDLRYRTVDQLKDSSEGRFGDSVKHIFRSTAYGRAITQSLRTLLRGHGDEHTAGSGNKRLPPVTASAPREFIYGVLAGLIDTTDGTICNAQSKGKRHTQLTVSVTSTSLQMLRDAKLVLDLIGIRSHISFSKVTTRGNKCWLLVLSSCDSFERLGPVVDLMQSPWKCEAFRAARRPDESAPSIQATRMLPLTDDFYTALYQAIPAPKTTTVRKDDQERAEVRALNSLKVAVAKSYRTSRRITQSCARRALELFERGSQFLNTGRVEALRAHTDFEVFSRMTRNTTTFWEAIESIEYTGRCETGYDLTVPGYETFVNSDGVVLSNTLGIFIPSGPEAVRDVKTRLMPSKQVFSIRDNEQVVNLPKQDLLWGLYRASTEPSGETHRFLTRKDAMRAIQQGRVKLSDNIEIVDTGEST